MKQKPRYAVVQMRSGSNVWENLGVIDAFVREAVAAGADAIFFPENALYRGPTAHREEAILGESSAVLESLKELSASWTIPVVLGSVLEASSEKTKPYNTTLILGDSRCDFAYKKIHLFDYFGSSMIYRESEKVRAGEDIACTLFDGVGIGLSICFDLRFPEYFRRLVLKCGARVLNIPAAFTRETGEAHWHTLLRARAIENLSFVLAAAQWGGHEDGEGRERHCFGHAIVYSPWGDILAEGPAEGDALLICDLDLKMQDEVRTNLPCLSLAKLL